MHESTHHKYYTNKDTEAGILVPKKIEHRVTKHVYGQGWLAIHIDGYAIISAHANDIHSAADDNRYDTMRQEIDTHNAEHPDLKIILGIDANTTLPTHHPTIGTHTKHINDQHSCRSKYRIEQLARNNALYAPQTYNQEENAQLWTRRGAGQKNTYNYTQIDYIFIPIGTPGHAYVQQPKDTNLAISDHWYVICKITSTINTDTPHTLEDRPQTQPSLKGWRPKTKEAYETFCNRVSRLTTSNLEHLENAIKLIGYTTPHTTTNSRKKHEQHDNNTEIRRLRHELSAHKKRTRQHRGQPGIKESQKRTKTKRNIP